MKTLAQIIHQTSFPLIFNDGNGSGNRIYTEFTNNNWYKRHYEPNGLENYYEDSFGLVYDYNTDSREEWIQKLIN